MNIGVPYSHVASIRVNRRTTVTERERDQDCMLQPAAKVLRSVTCVDSKGMGEEAAAATSLLRFSHSGRTPGRSIPTHRLFSTKCHCVRNIIEPPSFHSGVQATSLLEFIARRPSIADHPHPLPSVERQGSSIKSFSRRSFALVQSFVLCDCGTPATFTLRLFAPGGRISLLSLPPRPPQPSDFTTSTVTNSSLPFARDVSHPLPLSFF